MQRTKIHNLTHTWNPIAMLCAPVSRGCEHCWACRMAYRHARNPTLSPEMRAARDGGPPVLLEDELSAPLRLRKPAVIGVQFMGDLFHESIPFVWIDQVVGVAARCSQHVFVMLTKRPWRAVDWITHRATISRKITLPPNVWFGVSVEDQDTADERIRPLLGIPASVRWVSYEPALGGVRLTTICFDDERGFADYDALRGYIFQDGRNDPVDLALAVDWVVAGAETGSGKRPMDLDWARGVRDQCRAAGVPFFFKVDSDGHHTLEGVVHEEMP